MKNHNHIIKWATDCLVSKGYSLQQAPEFVQETPWSNVIRFTTSKGIIYLKQTPPSIFMEPKIIQLLANQLHASVPIVIAINDGLHCFLMDDAGITLRKYLKTEFQPDLLCKAINQFTTIQRATENHISSFLALDVPDWRLNQLPSLYAQLINQEEVLKAEGMTDEELKILYDLSRKVSQQCELLAQYQIPETLVQPDFNTNNILFNPISKQMTLIDLGEISIAHPFFSLHNYLLQATIHHDVKEQDQLYQKLQDTCFESWLSLATKKELLEAFMLTKKLWPIYFALAHYRLMMSVGLQVLKSFYANKPNQLAVHFRKYIASTRV
jgi:hypothetical protein